MAQKVNEIKAKLRLDINRSLLAVCFTVFALIISLNPSLFQSSWLVPTQLTLAIPLFLTSIFARSKLAFTKRPKLWEEYGFYNFLVAYSFLLNVLGILLSASIGTAYGLTFLLFNIITAFVYSLVEVIEDNSKFISRLKKDLLFTLLLVVGGILPAIFL